MALSMSTATPRVSTPFAGHPENKEGPSWVPPPPILSQTGLFERTPLSHIWGTAHPPQEDMPLCPPSFRGTKQQRRERGGRFWRAKYRTGVSSIIPRGGKGAGSIQREATQTKQQEQGQDVLLLPSTTHSDHSQDNEIYVCTYVVY